MDSVTTVLQFAVESGVTVCMDAVFDSFISASMYREGYFLDGFEEVGSMCCFNGRYDGRTLLAIIFVI